MIRTLKLFRTVRAICLITAVVGFVLPADTTAAERLSVRSARTGDTQQRLTLQQSSATAKKSSTAAKRKKATPTAAQRKAAAARAAAQARALREAEEPKFKLDDTGALIPDIRAEAAIIYNPETGEVLYESNARDQRSIASITKVMTALVFLESDADFDKKVVVQRSDVRSASTTYLRAGYEVTNEDLLHLLLIASDNAAARALARTSPYGAEGFIDQMNQKALDLGLTNTSYADPSGLLAANVSSAYDMARLITFVATEDQIASIMRKQNYQVAAGRRLITIHSTNRLVRQGDVDVQAGKTGFISKAGYCLATLLRLPQDGPQVAVVVLGAKSNAGRFWETRHLFNWLSSKASDLLETPVAAATPAVAQ